MSKHFEVHFEGLSFPVWVLYDRRDHIHALQGENVAAAVVVFTSLEKAHERIADKGLKGLSPLEIVNLGELKDLLIGFKQHGGSHVWIDPLEGGLDDIVIGLDSILALISRS